MAKLDQEDIDLVPGSGIVKIGASGVQMLEQATVPGPAIAATEGRLWLKNDAPNTLQFTDDAGTDFQLGAGGSLSEYSRLTGYTGKGSTNTNIIRFTTEAESGGSDITYTADATNGDYWAISATGMYSVSATIKMSNNNTGPLYINVAAALSNTLIAAHIRAAVHAVGVTGGG